MKPTLLCCLLVAFAAVAYARNDYNFKLFQNFIDEKCLSRWWTMPHSPNHMQPMGQSLEAFLSMVEKVEGNHTDWDIFRVTKELLKRFAFEEMIFKDVSGDRRGVQTSMYKNRWDILSKLLPEDHTEEDFREDDLSEEEKCTMFFMMGHLVNNTYREGIDDESTYGDVPENAGFPLNAPLPRTKRAKNPREQGVIGVDGSPDQAIAISKVLNAIVAGTSTMDHSAGDIIPDVTNKYFPKDRKINPLIGLTLGDVLSLASIYHKQNTAGSKFFGPGGTWNSSACPTEFKLHENATGSTNALLRGAVDGLLISHALSTWGNNIKGLKLSRVLRMYYSKKGFPMAHGMEHGVSYCRRNEVVNTIGQVKIQESVLTYYYLQMWKLHSVVADNSEEKVNEAISHMNSALSGMDQYSATEECRVLVQPDRPVCETPSHVFIVLDTSERMSQGIVEQENVTGLLASRIDFGRGSGSLSIFLDSLNSNELFPVAYNATNPTCAACKASWLERNNMNRREGNEVLILDALNKTLQRFEMATDTEPGVPSKSVIWFHYDSLTEKDRNRVGKAATILKNGHRDTRVFVVGQSRDELSVITREINDVLTETSPELLAKALEQKICKVPAIFQFNRCWDHKRTTRKEDDNVYHGYVTHNHVQFWAFHPEYYLKSYDIKVKFTVEQGDITVCEQRGVDNPGISNDGALLKDKGYCKTSDNSNRELTFTFKDPCKDYNVNNCPTMNFAIIGESKSSQSHMTIGCSDEDNKCRRLDQVKFKVSHEGISCSGCEFLKASPVFLLVVSLFYFFKH